MVGNPGCLPLGLSQPWGDSCVQRLPFRSVQGPSGPLSSRSLRVGIALLVGPLTSALTIIRGVGRWWFGCPRWLGGRALQAASGPWPTLMRMLHRRCPGVVADL